MNPQALSSIIGSAFSAVCGFGGLYFAHRQYQLQVEVYKNQMPSQGKSKKGANAGPLVLPRPSFPKANWVIVALMVFCSALSWVPYFLSSPQIAVPASDLIVAWGGGMDQGVIATVVDSRYLRNDSKRYSIVIVCVVQNSLEDDLENTFIAKSAAFSITGAQIGITIAPGVQFWEQLKLIGSVHITTYLTELPKEVSPDKISKLADVSALGGKVITAEGWGGNIRGVTLSPQKPNANGKTKP